MSNKRPHILSALKVPNFKFFWFGLIAQVLGQHMYQFTLGWLAFDISGSQAQLSFIQLCSFIPQFSLTLLGGALADRFDPKRLIQIAQSVSFVSVITIASITAMGDLALWHLACAAFIFGSVNGIDEPSRVSFFPRLLEKSQLPSGVPLVSMAFGTSRIVAPSIAGFTIASAGAPRVFLLTALGLSIMVSMLFMIKTKPKTSQPEGKILSNIFESVRYLKSKEIFSKVIIAAILNATLAMGYIHVLPVIAKILLQVDARGLGLLASAAGLGAVGGLFSYPWLQARTSPRNIMVYALSAYCLALIGLALSPLFWLSFFFLIVVGLGQANYLTSIQVTLQTYVQEEYRGRVMAIFSLVWSLVYLSGFILNFTGSIIGARLALVLNASIVLCYVWLSMSRSKALKNIHTLSTKEI
jgi:MFS family permease